MCLKTLATDDVVNRGDCLERTMDELLRELLEQLEEIGHFDQSLFDSAVRQSLGDAVFEGFALMIPDYVPPASFGMTNAEAETQVRRAIQNYLGSVRSMAAERGLRTFHARLAAIQNRSIKTDENRDFEDYLGYTDPACFDEKGDLIRSI